MEQAILLLPLKSDIENGKPYFYLWFCILWTPFILVMDFRNEISLH